MSSLKLTSPDLTHGQPIPKRFTCEGNDSSPALAWDGVPQGTRSLVLLVTDPDAPDPAAPRTTFTHWVLYNLPPESKGLAQDAVDVGAPGLNDGHGMGWTGPCPPIGRHRYFFRLLALDTQIGRASCRERVL